MDRVQISIRMRRATAAKLKVLAEREHRSMAGQVEHLVERAAADLPAAGQLDLEDQPRRRPRRAKA